MSEVIVWFDGACPLCAREIALMRRLDRAAAIDFVDVADMQSVCPKDRRQMRARFHVQEQGNLLSGAAAFAAMWRAIPLLRPLGLLARQPYALRVLEWLYGKFLIVRPMLQQFVSKGYRP